MVVVKGGKIKDNQVDWGIETGEVGADDVPTDTTNFNNNLSAADDTVQKALDTLDDTAGGGGVDTFLELTDTPSSYSGQSLKGARVNTGETAIEFYTVVDTDEKTKVSSNDTTAGYLNGKLIAGTSISLTENNNGEDETLTIANTAPDQTVTLTEGAGIDITGTYPDFTIASTITQYTDEMAQDAIGSALADSDSIVFTYNDESNQISADVKFKDSTENYYTIFEGGAQSDNITYTLPIALPDSNKFLQCDNLGVWSWVEGTGGGVTDHDDLNNLNWAAAGHTFDTDLDIGPYSQVFTEISTPANPSANDLKVYAKDVGGVTKLHTLDSAGTETELGAGGAGAGSLPELSDVDDALGYTNHFILQADGSQYTGNTYSHTWLDDIGSYAHADIDTHITSTNNPHSVTAAQAEAVALTGNEEIAGIKTFTSIPILPVANPTTDYQAAHKSYVDTVAIGLELKAASRVATIENITLSGEQTIDGINVVTGNRVLVKDQTDQTENGIYIADASAWSRATDYDESEEVQEGTFCNILEGTTNANKQFAQITKDPVLETDPLVFTQLSAPTVYTASGEGIEVSANEFDLELDGTSLTKSASGLKITAPVITSYGGTGLTSIGSSNEVLGVNNAADALEYKSFTAGSNITITHTEGDIEIASSLSGAPDYTYVDCTMHSHPASSFTWTNMPATLTAGTAYLRKKLDLTGAVQYRFMVNQAIAGYAGSMFRLRYSLNNSTFFDIGNQGNSGDLDVGTGTGVKVGQWEDLVSEAKQDIWLQIYGYNGDGIVDPAWRQVVIQVKYNSSIVDSSASDVVYKEVTIHAHPTSNAVWTNMPAAVTQFVGSAYNRTKANLSNCTHYRLVVNQSVAGYAGASINLRYSVTGTGATTSWPTADTDDAGKLDIGTGTIIKYGAWAPLVEAAKGDVWLGLIGKDGDGIADPAFRWVAIQFKERTLGQGVAGNDTEVLFNDEGSTGTDSAFTYNKTTNELTVSDVIIPTLFVDMTEPTGFVDREAILSWVDGTRTFAITGDHDIYLSGIKITKTTVSKQIADTTGLHWIYYDAEGVIQETTESPQFNDGTATIATVYWNTTTDKGLLGEERHGIKMDGETHHLLHYTVGTRYESGLTGTFGDTTFTITGGIIHDEDIQFDIAEQTTCNVLYKDGTADFKWLEAQTKYYYEDGGSDINYNDGNILTPVPANQYVAYWIFATNDTTTPIVSLMGQRVDSNIANARANNKYESLELGTLPFHEMKLLYRVILKNDATPYEETQDLRSVSNLPAGTYIATDHGVLTGLNDNDHPQYPLKADVETISGEWTYSTFPITPSAAPDADYEVANKKYVDDNAGGGPHHLLSATHPDTSPSDATRGDLIIGTSTPIWDNLALGSTGQFLKSDGNDVVWAEHGLTYADIKRTSVVLYMDCLALDTAGILLPRNWRDETVTSFVAQPDVPRQVTITVTPLFAETMVGTVTVNGVNSDGATIQSVKTFNTAVPETQTTSEAFALLTSIVTDSTPNIGNASQYQVGWNDTLGLPNYPFNATSDVYKIKKNNANLDSGQWTVNATYGTISFGTFISAGDDYTIWYRPYK